MKNPDDDYTPEELHIAQRLLDEKLRHASQEIYRQMVEANDPALYRGPVKVPRDVVMQLREAVAEEVRARRHAEPAPRGRHHPADAPPDGHPVEEAPPARRWPWQRR